MSEQEMRVALIGHQFMGIAHSNAFRNASMWTGLPGKITMKCVCANDTMDSFKAFASKYGWETCETDWRKVVKRDDIDLISIAAPNYLHKEIAIEAAKNGKHILCEKPLANNLSDSKEMPDAVNKAGVRHCCGFSYRFTPSLALARQLVLEVRIGKIYHVFVRYALLVSMFLINIYCQGPKVPVIKVFSSSQDGDRLTRQSDIQFSVNKESVLPLITINEDTIFQKIDGFGATFNEAGMICLNSLDPVEKEKVLQALFSSDSGAGYTLMKSPIGACDFASAGPWYTYNDFPGDTSMQHFTIERDLRPTGLIPFIKNASRYGRFEIQSPMDYAPDWMYDGLKSGEKHIKPEYYSALARYYSRYIKAYADNGVTINYLSMFNEGGCTAYTDITYKVIGEMIKHNVVPRLKADGLNTKILMGETCTRPQGLECFTPVLDDPEVRKHINKLAFHGYDWNNFSSIKDLHNRYPDISMWMTEVCYATLCCIPSGGPSKIPVYGFPDGQFWGNMIMNDMKNWVSGWIYWNMILDQDGGPWLTSPEHGDRDNNSQHPVVIVNRDTKEVTYTGLYYYLAHFSKFIRPGAYRINTVGGTDKLNFVGFKNADGNMVLNVINNGNATECKVSWMGKVTVAQFKAHSITTLMWNTKTKNQ